MTAMMKPALEVLVDANLLILLAFGLWRLTQAVLGASPIRHDYGVQLRILKATLLILVASPVLAMAAAAASQSLWPQTPITVRDIAVAAYLRGGIGIPAPEFEALLHARGRALEAMLTGAAPVLTALGIAFAAGAALHAGRLLRSVMLLRRVLCGSYLWRRTPKVDIRLSDRVTVPFAARTLRRRYIVLPSSLVAHPAELRYVLAHESEHLRAGDVEWEIAFEILRPLFFANPGFVLWKRAFDQLREISCDQSVIARRRIAPRDYSTCLLDFWHRRISGGAPRAMYVGFVRVGAPSTRRALEHRFLALQHGPVAGGGRAALTLAVCMLAVGLSMAAATIRQPGDWSHDRLMLSTIVNLERLRGY